MKVTIIIPNYNGKHFMEPCLQSLANQTCSEFQILVVDNASSDGSIEYMRENYPDIELISLNQNYGFSAAVNVGIRHSTTPYVLLLNNDTTVAPEFVDEMIKAIENPYTHIISHPGDGTAKLLFEPIVQAAKAHHTLLEINNSSLKPCRNKVEARPNNLEILRLCKQYEVPVILGSDAHISFDIATYDHALELVKETEFPESLILNTDVARFKQYLHLDK